ncbi:hypothetical protein MMC28_011217 [Mycoblastus sanguinarius]|nr:hypothetical protein [Mycoblastus sanguinarius]
MPTKNVHGNGKDIPKFTKSRANSWAKEVFLQSTPVPEPAAPTTQIFRMLLLAAYFWTCSVTIAMTQYVGAPLYILNRDYYYRYMAFTKREMTLLVLSMTQWWSSTQVHISGDESVQGQIRKLPDGRVECNFAARLVLIANHQLYNDWVYLWWTAYTNVPGMHGHVYIVLKESIKYIPLVGLGLRLAGFIFMSRNMKTDTPRLTRRLNQLMRRGQNEDLDPMWLMMFPEGTNLSKNGRAKSIKWARKQGCPDMQYQLIPRSTGTYFCLKALEDTVKWVYDCTLAYDGVPQGQYGQDIFTLRSTYLEGLPPVPIHMHWRRFRVSSIPLSTLEEFNAWLRDRWNEKELLLEKHSKTGQFPSSLSHGGSLTTEVKLAHWWELWRLGAVTILILGGFKVIQLLSGWKNSM